MNVVFETVIVGAGLAGASCAAILSRDPGLLILDAAAESSPDQPTVVYAAASTVGPGVYSPLMSRRARPVFRMPDAVSALIDMRKLTGEADLFSDTGVLKLAGSEEQAFEFRDASIKWPEHGQWITESEALIRWPDIHAPFGLIHVLTGGSVSIPGWTGKMIGFSVARGATYRRGCRLLGWRESERGIDISYRDADHEIQSVRADRLLMAPGADYLRFPELAALRLHPIKGQWVKIGCPDSLDTDGSFPAVSGSGYLIRQETSFVAGSTFEHDYRHVRAVREDVTHLVTAASAMLPELKRADPVASGAAIRVTVPGIRLPMVGPPATGITRMDCEWPGRQGSLDGSTDRVGITGLFQKSRLDSEGISRNLFVTVQFVPYFPV